MHADTKGIAEGRIVFAQVCVFDVYLGLVSGVCTVVPNSDAVHRKNG